MSELKPCPFCGGQAETRLDDRWWVHCVNCTCEIGFEGMDENGYYGHFETEAKAIDAWNTRAERTCKRVDVNGYSFRFECSTCGYVALVHNCETRLDELPKYCPNCGAKVVDA